MQIIEKKISNKIIEYNTTDSSKENTTQFYKEWNTFVQSKIIEIVKDGKFILLSNKQKKNSLLNELGNLTKSEFYGIDYCYSAQRNFDNLLDIIEDSEFYLGNVVLIVGHPSENFIIDFIHNINFVNKLVINNPLECLLMQNDGKSLYWIKPTK